MVSPRKHDDVIGVDVEGRRPARKIALHEPQLPAALREHVLAPHTIWSSEIAELRGNVLSCGAECESSVASARPR
jgi:hypothetical protein